MNEEVRKEYESKLMTADQFPDLIQNGDVIMNALGTGACSNDMHDALMDRYEEFEGVRFQDTVQIKPSPFHNPENALKVRDHIRTEAWYFLNPLRKIGAMRITDFIPIMTEDCTEAITRETNVFTTMCTPPNDRGYVNLSMSNFFSKELINTGREKGQLRTVIAEVNDQLPVVYGDNWVHMSKIDHILEKSSPVPVFSRTTPTGVENEIAEHVLELINDGDCIQMGLGGITEAVIPQLDKFKDLGINSEMLPAGLSKLVAKGAVSNLNKPERHKGVSTATFIMGDQELYDFSTENPDVQLFCCDYINHPITIAQNPQVAAINMGLMVDLTGQIAAEGLGYRQISGTGGQLDFAIGAHWSPGGKSMVLLTSARKLADGTLGSSIVPSLPEGTPVSVPRMYAEYIITEYGIANLRGKSRQQRAKELIAIAHPEFREQLKQAALAQYWPDGAKEFSD